MIAKLHMPKPLVVAIRRAFRRMPPLPLPYMVRRGHP